MDSPTSSTMSAELFQAYDALRLYVDEQSGDAAYLIASPLQWQLPSAACLGAGRGQGVPVRS